MQDTGVFLSVAEIAGVFVGFGALIAIRSGGASGALEVGVMRSMVSTGLMTIGAALVPANLSRYELTEHEVLALSSALFLVGWLLMWVIIIRTPEYRANLALRRTGRVGLVEDAVEGVASVLYMIATVLLPLIIVSGLLPEIEAALYLTLVLLVLLLAGWLLLWLVFMPRRPETA